jgi:hypothetical protein
VRITFCFIVVMLLARPADAGDGDVGETLRSFGLMGTWASDCSSSRPPFRLIIAEPPGGGPVYTTINIDDGHKTTVHSLVQSAVLLPPHQLKLRLRIFGGDMDGGPLPSPTTNTFDQTFEKLPGHPLRMVGIQPLSLQPCSG